MAFIGAVGRTYLRSVRYPIAESINDANCVSNDGPIADSNSISISVSDGLPELSTDPPADIDSIDDAFNFAE